MFSTAYEIERQGLRHVSDEDIGPENVHELPQVPRPMRINTGSPCINFFFLLEQNTTNSVAWNNTN